LKKAITAQSKKMRKTLKEPQSLQLEFQLRRFEARIPSIQVCYYTNPLCSETNKAMCDKEFSIQMSSQ
jgi:hypothetical protein